MNPVEDALIRRLDARCALATVLGRQNERRRAVLIDLWRSGCTYRETGERFGLSSQRVGQIHRQGLYGVEQALKEKPRRPFDKVAFLEHMRRLIRLREQDQKERDWKREMAVMSHFVKLATPIPRPPPPSPPVVSYAPALTVWSAPTNVEPWFDPNRMPTPDDQKQIELYAVNYFAAALGVPSPGAGVRLTLATYRLSCARDADAIAGTLYPLAISIRAAGRSRDFLGLRAYTLGGAEVMIEIEFYS